MKVTLRISLCLIAVSGICMMTGVHAADAVYLRANDAGVIELSNVEEVDNGQVPVAVDTAPGARPVNAAPAGPLTKQAAPTGTKTGPATEEDASASAAEGCTEREPADGQTKEACDKKKLARASAGSSGSSQIENSSNYSGGSMGNVYYGTAPVASTGTGSSTTTGSDTTTGTTPGNGASTVGTGSSGGSGTDAGTGTTTGASTTAGSGTTTGSGTKVGTGTTNGTGTAAGTGTVDAALATTLQQYRDLMLQQAAAANINDNHAVSRRYLMTNRSTYQAAIGVVAP